VVTVQWIAAKVTNSNAATKEGSKGHITDKPIGHHTTGIQLITSGFQK
jgi:hypothetical protein